MTLSEAIRQRQAQRSTRAHRDRQDQAERRADEIASVLEIRTDYTRVDRDGDLAIEARFQALYQLVDTEAEKEAVASAFAVWIRTERAEDLAVGGSVVEAVELLKSNNPYWLGASEVPKPRWLDRTGKDLTGGVR